MIFKEIFQVFSMKFISQFGIMLKCCSNLRLTSINKLNQDCHARVILHNVGEVYIFNHSFNIRALILSNFVRL